jgi:undecaprenyl-phosphate galactose phosphotransferase
LSAVTGIEQIYDSLDQRTIELLERHNATKDFRSRGWLVRRALLIADVAGLSSAFLVAQEVYTANVARAGSLSRVSEFIVFALSLPLWIVAAKLYGLYDKDEERTDHSTADDFARLFHLITVCTFLLFALLHATRWLSVEFSKLFFFWLLAIASTFALRSAARWVCRRQVSYIQNTIVVGAGEVGQGVARKFLRHPEYGINLVGFVDDMPKARADDLEHLVILGSLSDLPKLVELLDVERVVFAFSNDTHRETLRLMRELRRSNVQIDIVPRLFDGLGPSTGIHDVQGMPLISLPPNRLPWSSVLIKRALDLGAAFVGILVLWPLFLLIALMIKLDSRGPVFYRHQRIGKDREPFWLLKFRTMELEACRGPQYGGEAAEREFESLMRDPDLRREFETNFKLQDDPRVTRLGRILRRTSLDEVPQLFNVMCGDLSLVGPRALTEEEIDLYYGDEAPTLLGIRPGITGYWQVNGRSHLEYEDRVQLDLTYLGGWSLGLDLAILARTARVLTSRGGAA